MTAGFACPLTSWEKTLRRRGGENPYTGGFIDHYLEGRLFPHGWDRPIQAILALVVAAAYARLIAARRRERDP